MTDGYSTRDVGKLLGLPRTVVYALIGAGFVTPGRGARREYRFSFPDLVVLRAAQALSDARIPPSRILRSLKRLRAQLPDEMPLAGLRIEAVGDSVVVSEGEGQWRPDDGQYMLQFELAPPGGKVAFIAPPKAAPASVDEPWFDRGVALEEAQPDAAVDAYGRALAADRHHRDAYVNLGRLLHERGRLRDAEGVYREGLRNCGADATLLFNLGVLYEDASRERDAAASYRAALDAAPDFADAHFNLARLCEAQGLPKEAVRHWNAFRKLSGRR